MGFDEVREYVKVRWRAGRFGSVGGENKCGEVEREKVVPRHRVKKNCEYSNGRLSLFLILLGRTREFEGVLGATIPNAILLPDVNIKVDHIFRYHQDPFRDKKTKILNLAPTLLIPLPC